MGSCTDSTNANGCYTYQAPVITCNAAGHYYDSKNDCKQACNDCTTCSQVAQGTYTGCWTYPCSGDAQSSWEAEFYTENECYAAYPESGTCYYKCVQNYISGCYNVEQNGSCSNPEPSTEIFIRYAYEQVNVPYGSHSGSGNLLGGSYTYASDARGGYYQLTGVDTSVNYTQWYAYINDNPASPVGITEDGIRYDVSGRNTIRICGMVQWAGANNLHNSIGMTALFVRKVGDAAGDVHFYMKGTGQNTCKFNSDAYVSGIGSCQFIEDVCYHSANGCATGAYTCNIDDMYQGGAPSASIWYHNRSILDGKARADWYSYCYDMPVTGGKSYVVNMAVATDNAPTCAQ